MPCNFHRNQTLPYWKDWPRCFCHIDMVAFFASIEQQDFPELREKPVVVINAEQGTTIITSSYEARAFGIKTGMHVNEAKTRCADITVRVARPARYAQLSHVIFLALQNHISPDIEMFSIDEAFFDLKPVLKLHPSIEALAERIDETVKQASRGLKSTIGISEGKLTAKICGQMNKGRITIITAAEIKSYLEPVEVNKICGIGPAMTQYLYQQGIKYCRELANKPMSILSNKWGNIGKRLYLTSQGHDPEPLRLERPVKSMGQSKILPPNTRDIALIKATAHRLLERLCQRIHDNQFTIDQLKITVSGYDATYSDTFRIDQSACDSFTIWHQVRAFFDTLKQQGYHKVSLQAGALSDQVQYDFLSQPVEPRVQQINALKDHMRKHFGRDILHTADQLSALHQPVISPSYRQRTDGDSITEHSGAGVAEPIRRVLTKSGDKPIEKIKYELHQLGLNTDEVNAAIEHLETDEKKLEKIIKRELSATRWSYKNVMKIKGAVQRLGFSYQLINDVINTIEQMLREDDEV